jgi:ABC-type multidrug transport system fused ATPase/permease subunit
MEQESDKIDADADLFRSSLRNATSSRKNHLQTLFNQRRLIFALLKENTHRDGMSFSDVEESVSDDDEPKNSQQPDHPVDIQPLSGPLLEIMNKLQEYKPILQRMRSLNIPVEVRIRNLTYTVQTNQDVKLETVFSTSLFYRLYKWYKVKMSGASAEACNLVSKNVLDDISLHFQPGKMYLILGPPASGKTTLMRCIAGLLHPQKAEVLNGAVTYNGREMKVSHSSKLRGNYFVFNYKRLSRFSCEGFGWICGGKCLCLRFAA